MSARFPEHPERRAAVVTGASSGIGQATAELLAARGHPVVIGARRLEALEGIAESIRAEGGEAHAFHLDLGDADSVAHFVDATQAAVGEVEVIVANAARNQVGAILETPPEELEAVLDVNVGGAHRLVTALLPPMIERRRGVIVNFSSGWGRSTDAEVAPYCATKWAIEGLTQSFAQELPSGMAAVALNPGIINTDMLRSCFAGSAANFPPPSKWAERAVPFLLNLGSEHNGHQVTVPGA